MSTTLVCLALGISGCWVVLRLLNRLKHPLPLPPGPPGDFIFGHARTMPSANVDLVFHEWAKKYGDVMHISCFSRDIIILDSDQAAVDLLDKRGTLYSDRPNISVYPLMGWTPDMVFMRYGEQWRFHRKLLHSYFTDKAISRFQPIQLANAYILVQGLIENKGNHDNLLGRFSTSVVIRIGYGHQIVSDDDEYIEIANNSGRALRSGGPPGGTLLDFFPILQYLPSWFPGTHFANVAREWRGAIDKLFYVPFDKTMKQIAEGTANDSFLSSYIASRDGPLSDTERAELRGTTAVIYGAGTETTWSSLATFILAMLIYPECQRLGQEEVDRVVGRDRLPTFKDRDSLPYVNAVVEEVLRWNPSVPLGIAHRVTHDDIYRGMYIPKDSYVFANAGGISRDDRVYKDPDIFDPVRFIPQSKGGSGEPLFGAAFGYGRRICPGRHLATASVYIAVATILSTLNLSKAKDENGHEITPKVEFNSGFTSHPTPYSCHITLRSEIRKALIDDEVEAATMASK